MNEALKVLENPREVETTQCFQTIVIQFCVCKVLLYLGHLVQTNYGSITSIFITNVILFVCLINQILSYTLYRASEHIHIYSTIAVTGVRIASCCSLINRPEQIVGMRTLA